MVSSAIAYQRTPTRQRVRLDHSRCSPARPSSSAVSASPLVLGPSSISKKMRPVSRGRKLNQIEARGAEDDQDAAPTDPIGQCEVPDQRVAPEPGFERHGLAGGMSSFTISARITSSCPTQV